jgi:3-oxoacyl-[acyl-carrier-protein] synthase II
MRAAITALGVVSPIGIGEAAFFAALGDGSSAIARDHDGVLAARVGDFGAAKAIAPGNLRRMPRLSQMTIVAAKQALAAAALPYDLARVGVVLGTGLGTLEETIAFMRGYVDGGPEAASPLLFPSSVMNAAAGQLALECKLRGVNSTVNHRDASPLLALTMACDLLALGRADALLVGGVDELSAPALVGYRKLGVLTATALKPYATTRDGLVPGEGAAIVVVEREEDARRRGARVRAVVSGRGETGETRPRVGWGQAAAWPAAARAVKAAAGERRIDFVAGGGNGTIFDERELSAIAAGLGALPPTASILGQTGESFASASLRLLAAIFALEQQTLPATVGMDAPLREQLVREKRQATVERVLVPSFAQGGANVAVVLER